MSNYLIGQRWISEAEPELGLGLIVKVESKTVEIEFKSSETLRVYGLKSAPLKRVEFSIGDSIQSHCGLKSLIVEDVQTVEGLLVYLGDNQVLHEVELSHHLSFNRPQDKLFSGLISEHDLFNLRYETLNSIREYEKSSVRGFLGGRMSLLPHQFYVASKIVKDPLPRVLLADEVGLGKTIEAGLVLHNLLKSERASRVLILVPDSLVYQWFVEMRKKFNLNFSTINQETYLEAGMNPFTDNELAIASLDLLRGSDVARDLLSKSNWDVVVVDEAHQLKWKKDGPDMAFQVVESVTKRTPMAFLLTATPEQLGLKGHFARLKLLDENRFYDYEQFKREVANFSQIAEVAKSILKGDESDNEELNELGIDSSLPKGEKLNALLDRHGTGRMLYRNTRSNLSKDYKFFPKRILHSYELTAKASSTYKDPHSIDDLFYEKARWLCEFLKEKNEKVLLICRSKAKVLELEQLLKENIAGIKSGVFHSDLSLMARDRQAVYFADPEGAQVLLCTEIGSEGRNFEFCHHLVLFDLPLSVDILEQRIGRLDRIGQKFDINLHVPYGKNCFEEVLFHWFNDGVGAFTKNCRIGIEILNEVRNDLIACLEGQGNLNELLSKTKEFATGLEKKLEEGRDMLIEYNSFHSKDASKIVDEVKKLDEDRNLYEYLDKVFHQLGVESDELDAFTTFIRPGHNMMIPHFPSLPSEGMRITFDRTTALLHEDVQLMTWDHPLVSGTLDLVRSESVGSVCVTQRKGGKAGKSYLECYFLLSPLKGKGLDTYKYLPLQTIRVLINAQGEDLSAKWEKEKLDGLVEDASTQVKQKAMKLPKELVDGLLEKARGYANSKADQFVEAALKSASTELSNEIQRLVELGKVNPSVREEEIEYLKEKKNKTLEMIASSEVVFDSLRLIL